LIDQFYFLNREAIATLLVPHENDKGIVLLLAMLSLAR